MKIRVVQPPWAPAGGHGAATVRFGRLVLLRFLAQGMTVYAGALAYRGLLALVPLALLLLALVGLLGLEGSVPRLTAALLRLRGAPGAGGAAVPLEGLLSAGAAVGAVFRFGPSVRPPGRAVAAGAALTVALWAVVSAGFGLAVSTVLDYGSTYGGLGAAVALLVYLNLLALVLLLGAEVSAEVARHPAGVPGGEPATAESGRP